MTRELLSEVISNNVISDGSYVDGYMYYSTENSNHGINIYELAHMCKEWAYINQKGNIDRWLVPKKNPEWEHDQFACYVNGYPHKYIYTDTEPEAIFKACEWILEQKEK